MAAQPSIAKLHSPLKELVTAASAEITSSFGRTEKEQAEVAEWVAHVAAGTIATPEDLKVCVSFPNVHIVILDIGHKLELTVGS